MWFTPADGGYLVRLERGEELVASLRGLIRTENIRGGAVAGLGAVENPLLGYFDRDAREYVQQRVDGIFELLSVSGTLSWFDGEPFAHVHVVLGDREMRAVGGHCFEAEVAATVELRVWTGMAARVERRMDDGLGLHLLELQQRVEAPRTIHGECDGT